MFKFRVGDKVKITRGKDSGREGKIEKIFPKKGTVLIPDINLYKKHVKGAEGKKGGIYDVPRPLSVGKFVLLCPRCGKKTRVGLKLVAKEKLRVCKKCKREIDAKPKK